jgi:hypothetical protein
LYRPFHIIAGLFQPRSHAGVSVAFEENFSANLMVLQSFRHRRPKQPAFEGMRANVRVCNVSWIDLASHHKRSAHDSKPLFADSL